MEISSAELASARADLESMLPDTATITRKTETPDGAGGFDTTWPTVAVDVPCRLSPLSPLGRAVALRVTGDRINDATTHILSFAANLDVQASDRAVIGPVTYEVLLVRTAGLWELSRHTEVREVPGG